MRGLCSVDARRLSSVYASRYPLDRKCDQVVTKACTGYSARPPFCYALPKGSALISALALCMGNLLVPAPRAQQGGSRVRVSVPAEKEVLWQPCPPRFRCPTVAHPYTAVPMAGPGFFTHTLCCGHTTLTVSMQPAVLP